MMMTHFAKKFSIRHRAQLQPIVITSAGEQQAIRAETRGGEQTLMNGKFCGSGIFSVNHGFVAAGNKPPVRARADRQSVAIAGYSIGLRFEDCPCFGIINRQPPRWIADDEADRKSTRLNSSHLCI